MEPASGARHNAGIEYHPCRNQVLIGMSYALENSNVLRMCTARLFARHQLVEICRYVFSVDDLAFEWDQDVTSFSKCPVVCVNDHSTAYDRFIIDFACIWLEAPNKIKSSSRL